MSNYHKANLRANPDLIPEAASLPATTVEGMPAFQGFQLAHHEVKDNQVIYQVTQREASSVPQIVRASPSGTFT